MCRLPSSRGEAYHDGMRIFLAGASGVIGQRLIPRLVQAGHVVGGLTRSPSKTELLSHLGAEPILCDVFDREALIQAVRNFKPDVILYELTDLPDDVAQISKHAGLNARIRTEGNQNLIEAARRSGSPKILAQSVAWQLPDGPDALAVKELERSVLAEGGVVLSYGQFYGPGTYNPQQPPEEPRVHIDRAAERTVEVIGEPTGVVVIIDCAREDSFHGAITRNSREIWLRFADCYRIWPNKAMQRTARRCDEQLTTRLRSPPAQRYCSVMRRSAFDTRPHPTNIHPHVMKRFFHCKDCADDSCFHLI
jgi:hypothetical protein